MDSIIRCNPKIIFLNIGINDLIYQFDSEQTINNYYSIIEILRTKLPNSRVVVIGIYPVSEKKCLKIKNETIQKMNLNIKKICDLSNIEYVDLSDVFSDDNDYTSDGVHLKGCTYNKIGERLHELLR